MSKRNKLLRWQLLFRVENRLRRQYLISIVAVALVAAMMSDGMGSVPNWPSVPEQWRGKRFDAVNALFMFLQLHGKAISRHDIVEHLGGIRTHESLQSLCSAANHFDVPAAVYHCDLDALSRFSLPAIVYIEAADNEEGGAFWLVIGFEKRRRVLTAIEAGTVVFTELSADEFLRAWSGYALLSQNSVRASAFANSGRVLILAIALGFGAVGLFVLTRRTFVIVNHRAFANR